MANKKETKPKKETNPKNIITINQEISTEINNSYLFSRCYVREDTVMNYQDWQLL